MVDPSFKVYSQQVVSNSKALASALMGKGYKLVTSGTDNHLVLWDLRPLGLTGSKMEKVCDLCHITLNKNAVFGDASALTPVRQSSINLYLLLFIYCDEIDREASESALPP